MLDEILNALPDNAVAANNRAVLAVEAGDFKRARSLFEHADAIAGDSQIDDVTLEIGIQSADNDWLSFFNLLQPADKAIEQFSYVTHMADSENDGDPLTVTMKMSTPGAAQLSSLKAGPCKHDIADKARPTYRLKQEIENNLKALDGLIDSSKRQFCW